MLLRGIAVVGTRDFVDCCAADVLLALIHEKVKGVDPLNWPMKASICLKSSIEPPLLSVLRIGNLFALPLMNVRPVTAIEKGGSWCEAKRAPSWYGNISLLSARLERAPWRCFQE